MNPEILRMKKAYCSQGFVSMDNAPWNFFNPAYLYHVQKRDRHIIKLLRRYGMDHLSDKKILDIGCGTGREIRKMGLYGACPENLYGVDLLPHRIEKAKTLNPGSHFQIANAEHLPFPNESFDLIMQFTCFSSVLDFYTRKNMANEVRRVLKSHGIFIWFDMRPVPIAVRIINGIEKRIMWYPKKDPHSFFNGETFKNSSPPISPILLEEIRDLFQGCFIHPELVSLFFPWGGVARYVWALASFLESFPFFRTHWLIAIQKKDRK